jgi:hypothetical protein
MLDHVSDCARNIIEAAMTERTRTRIRVKSSAAPFSFECFMGILSLKSLRAISL